MQLIAADCQVPSELVAALLSKVDDDATEEERTLAASSKGGGAGGAGAGAGGVGGFGRGAVLIFLPGVPEIRRLQQDLARSPNAARWLLLPLHGELPAQEQRKVFQRPPPSQRKVILATNVAETSLTIDDVTVVIDTGRVKQASFRCAPLGG